MKIRIYHAVYGCDTGCCGHYIEVEKDDKTTSEFDFGHPYNEDPKEWATKLIKEFLEKEFPDCVSTIDWDSIDYSEVSEY